MLYFKEAIDIFICPQLPVFLVVACLIFPCDGFSIYFSNVVSKLLHLFIYLMLSFFSLYSLFLSSTYLPLFLVTPLLFLIAILWLYFSIFYSIFIEILLLIVYFLACIHTL